MFQYFKYLNIMKTTREGMENPDKLLSDTSFGMVKGLFWISFLLLLFLSAVSLFFGFSYDYSFLKIIGFIFVAFLIIDIVLYILLKRFVARLSSKIVGTVKRHIPRTKEITRRVIEVDVHNEHRNGNT